MEHRDTKQLSSTSWMWCLLRNEPGLLLLPRDSEPWCRHFLTPKKKYHFLTMKNLLTLLRQPPKARVINLAAFKKHQWPGRGRWISVSSKLASSTYWVSGQPSLHNKILSQKQNKKALINPRLPIIISIMVSLLCLGIKIIRLENSDVVNELSELWHGVQFTRCFYS